MPGGAYSGGCAWCGSYPHKPNCQALASNYDPYDREKAERMYGRSSLQTQRETTKRLREELDRRTEQTLRYGSDKNSSGPSGAVIPPPAPDTRTELQKRFDAIAEEVADDKTKE